MSPPSPYPAYRNTSWKHTSSLPSVCPLPYFNCAFFLPLKCKTFPFNLPYMYFTVLSHKVPYWALITAHLPPLFFWIKDLNKNVFFVSKIINKILFSFAFLNGVIIVMYFSYSVIFIYFISDNNVKRFLSFPCRNCV